MRAHQIGRMLNRSTSFIGLALIVALGGCRDTTAPNKPFALALSVDTPTSAPVFSDTPDGPRITCNFSLTAKATGDGSAQWQDVQTLFYFGTNRAVVADSISNPASDAQSAFGAATIAGGEARHGKWYLYAGAPFEANIGFTYRLADGTTSMASTHVTCGPTPQGAVVPTITQLSIPNTTGELKIGDVITVTYEATGTSGIWESIVQITGGFQDRQVFGERLATATNHTVQFTVPPTIKPGIPITISALVWNGALVGSSKAINTQLALIDRTPPTILSAQTYASKLGGQYAVGDSVTLIVSAHDDIALGRLVYELGAPANVKDSVDALPAMTNEDFVLHLPVGPEWVGSPVLSLTVRDAMGLTSQTLSSAPGAFQFYPIVNRVSTSPLSLGSEPTNGMLYDAKRDLMYIGLQGTSAILVLSPNTMTLRSSIQLPAVPTGMDLSLSGDSLLAAMPSAGTIAVVNLNDPSASPSQIRLSVLDTVTPSPGGLAVAPGDLRIAANGKMMILLTNATLQGNQTLEVDLTTGAQRIRTDAHWLSEAALMDRNPNRSRIYVLSIYCWSFYDASSDMFTSCANPPYVPQLGGMTFDATGQHMTYGAGVLDADTHVLWGMRGIYNQPATAALSPDGATVYFGAGQSLRTARLADTTMLSRTPIPVSPDRLFVAPNGQWLLAFQNLNSVMVTRVDLQ